MRLAVVARGWLPDSEFRNRLVRGVSWSFLATLFAQGSVFALSLILSHIFGRDEFGRYAMIQSTVLMMVAVSQLATGYTATKYVAEYRVQDTARVGRLLGLCRNISACMGLLGAGVLFFAAGPIASTMLHGPDLETPVRIASIAVGFGVLNGFHMGALAGFEAYNTLARISWFNAFVSLVLCSAGALLGRVNGVAVALALTGAVQLLAYRRALTLVMGTHGVRIGAGEIWRENKVLLRFMLPAALSGLSSMPTLWLCNALLSRSAGFAAVALYAVANNFRLLVLVLPTLFNNTSNALLNNRRGARDLDRYVSLFKTNLAAVALIAFGVAVVLGATGRPLLGLFGSGFGDGFYVLLVLLIAGVIEAVNTAAYLAIQSQERLWFSFCAVVIPRDLLILLLSAALIPRYGALGLAASYAAGCLTSLLVVGASVVRSGLRVAPPALVEPTGAPERIARLA